MYIVLEGIVGSGKTTQVHRLMSYLETRFPDKKVICVREPGSTPIAEEIRHLAQSKEWENDTMLPMTNAYLFAAARAQTIGRLVGPALERGDIVVSDRSFVSSLAIQGEAQEIGIDEIFSLNTAALGGYLPDLIVFLDVDLDRALARTFDAAGDKWETMEKPFFERILMGYEKAKHLPQIAKIWREVDARGSLDEVARSIEILVRTFFHLP